MIKLFITLIIFTQSVYWAGAVSTIKNEPNELNEIERIKNRFQSSHNIEYEEMIDNEIHHLKDIALDMEFAFTNVPMPKLITQPMADAVLNETDQLNQYAVSAKGHRRLRKALSQFYVPLIHRTINVKDEILITSGATSAMYIALQSHIDHGDEVIIIEPYYTPFRKMVKQVGGVPRYVALRPTNASTFQQISSSADWKFNWTEFEQAFNSKTKMLILNNPLNPLGKMYTLQELENIAMLCKRWNVVVLSDEVYEFLPLNGRKHIRICTLPGMWDRTITVGSAGKAFQVSGWRIGWAYGPSVLLHTMIHIQDHTLYTVSTPAQEAIAIGFENEIVTWGTSESYLSNLPSEVQEKVHYFINILLENGWKVIVPEAGFLLVADWSPFENLIDLSKETGNGIDFRFLKWFARNIGILGTTLAMSRQNQYLAEHLIRLCVFKTNETLKLAAFRLSKLLLEYKMRNMYVRTNMQT